MATLGLFDLPKDMLDSVAGFLDEVSRLAFSISTPLLLPYLPRPKLRIAQLFKSCLINGYASLMKTLMGPKGSRWTTRHYIACGCAFGLGRKEEANRINAEYELALYYSEYFWKGFFECATKKELEEAASSSAMDAFESIIKWDKEGDFYGPAVKSLYLNFVSAVDFETLKWILVGNFAYRTDPGRRFQFDPFCMKLPATEVQLIERLFSNEKLKVNGSHAELYRFLSTDSVRYVFYGKITFFMSFLLRQAAERDRDLLSAIFSDRTPSSFYDLVFSELCKDTTFSTRTLGVLVDAGVLADLIYFPAAEAGRIDLLEDLRARAAFTLNPSTLMCHAMRSRKEEVWTYVLETLKGNKCEEAYVEILKSYPESDINDFKRAWHWLRSRDFPLSVPALLRQLIYDSRMPLVCELAAIIVPDAILEECLQKVVEVERLRYLLVENRRDFKLNRGHIKSLLQKLYYRGAELVKIFNDRGSNLTRADFIFIISCVDFDLSKKPQLFGNFTSVWKRISEAGLFPPIDEAMYQMAKKISQEERRKFTLDVLVSLGYQPEPSTSKQEGES